MSNINNLPKWALILAVAASFTASACATSIDFAGIGNGGSWSWDGSGPLSITDTQVQIQTPGSGPPAYTVSGASAETITTGDFTGGSGTITDPWTFAPVPSDTIAITGCEPSANPCLSPVTLFSGQFTGTQSLVSGEDGMILEAPDVSGTVDPDLWSYLGLPDTSSTSVAGMLTFSLTGTVPGDVTGAGDLVLADPPGSPTPEPVSMVLVGTGLLAIGIALRWRRFGLKSGKLLSTVPIADRIATRIDARPANSAGRSNA